MKVKNLPLRLRLALLLPALGIFTPVPGTAQLQVVNTPSESLTLGGWLQPVAEFRSFEDADSRMGTYFRRARLDLSGSLLEGKIRFRVYPELAPTVSLRDLWVEWRTESGFAFRGGQQVVPFDLQREKSMGRAHFGDRAVAARRFELSGGRDVGITGRWANSAGTRQISVGVFNGVGANRRELVTSPLFAGRGSLSFGGSVASAETDLNRSENPVVTLGAGVMIAKESGLRPRPGFTNEALTDWAGLTMDLHGRWQGFSLAGSLFGQTVSPIDSDTDIDGSGWFLSGGWVLPGSPAQVSVKHSRAQWDDTADESETETAVGVTLFHRGHEIQTRIQLIFEENPLLSSGGEARVLTIEHQLLLGG